MIFFAFRLRHQNFLWRSDFRKAHLLPPTKYHAPNDVWHRLYGFSCSDSLRSEWKSEHEDVQCDRILVHSRTDRWRNQKIHAFFPDWVQYLSHQTKNWWVLLSQYTVFKFTLLLFLSLADTWPRSLDDSTARKDWGWNPEHNLTTTTQLMLDLVAQKLNRSPTDTPLRQAQL